MISFGRGRLLTKCADVIGQQSGWGFTTFGADEIGGHKFGVPVAFSIWAEEVERGAQMFAGAVGGRSPRRRRRSWRGILWTARSCSECWR